MSTDLAAALAKRFSPITADDSPGLVLQLYGPPGSGKTDFALRAPGPVIHFGFDYHGFKRPANRLLAEYPEAMKRVFPKTYSLKPRDRKYSADDVAQEQTRNEVLLPFLEDFEYAVGNGARTLVLDTFDLLRQTQIIARFGKLEQNSQTAYQEINAETARLIHTAREAGKVLILIVRMKEEYKETMVNGKAISKSTGKLIPDANAKLAHAVDASLEMTSTKAPFRLTIVDAKTNKAANGNTLDNPSFAEVASQLKPLVDLSAWE